MRLLKRNVLAGFVRGINPPLDFIDDGLFGCARIRFQKKPDDVVYQSSDYEPVLKRREGLRHETIGRLARAFVDPYLNLRIVQGS